MLSFFILYGCCSVPKSHGEDSAGEDYCIQFIFSVIASLAAPNKSRCSSVRTEANFVIFGSSSFASA